MRWILLSALIALWAWFAIRVAPRTVRAPRPVPVAEASGETTAASLHNEGVSLNRRGRPGDALAYFERAASFRPLEKTYSDAVRYQRARLEKRAWLRVLVPGTIASLALLLVATLRRAGRRHRDRCLLRRLRLRGAAVVRVRRDDEVAEVPLRFNHDVEAILARHPLTVVWSSSRHGKHMKSRPPVSATGRRAVLRLDGERLERLRRYPGDWKCFLYLDGLEVGEAVARVG